MVGKMEGLPMTEEKRKYIRDTLNPVLEEFVCKCLVTLQDPLVTMLSFALERSGGAAAVQIEGKLGEENKKLREENEKLRKQIQAGGAAQEEEEEEDEDDLDEPPPNFYKPEGQMNQMRSSVSAECYGAWNQQKTFDPPNYPKTDEQRSRLKTVLSKSFLFSAVEGPDVDLVIGAMKERVAAPNERLIQQGENGDYLFVIEEGVLDCKKQVGSDAEKVVKTCEAGDCFGELALLYNCPRAASVDSREKSVLWQLDRETFNHIVRNSASKKRERYDAFLATVPLLSGLDAYERSQIADALCREKYEAGATVVRENDSGDKFFIIESGTAYAEKSGVGKVMDYNVGDYFGELALLQNQPRAATVKAVGELTVLSLPRGSFKRLLGPLDGILARGATKYS